LKLLRKFFESVEQLFLRPEERRARLKAELKREIEINDEARALNVMANKSRNNALLHHGEVYPRKEHEQ
jgi:hypothetical protein